MLELERCRDGVYRWKGKMVPTVIFHTTVNDHPNCRCAVDHPAEVVNWNDLAQVRDYLTRMR